MTAAHARCLVVSVVSGKVVGASEVSGGEAGRFGRSSHSTHWTFTLRDVQLRIKRGSAL